MRRSEVLPRLARRWRGLAGADLGLSQIAAHLNRTDHTTAHHSYTTFCAMVAQGRYAAERTRVEAILEADNG